MLIFCLPTQLFHKIWKLPNRLNNYSELCICIVSYKLSLTKNNANEWTAKAFTIYLYGDWTRCWYSCWPSTTPEGVYSGLRHSVLQGIWLERSLDSGIFLERRLPWSLRQLSVCLQCWRPRFDPWVEKILWRRKWQPTPVLLPGKSHGRSLVGYSPWSPKESNMTEWLYFTYLLQAETRHLTLTRKAAS